MSACALAAEFVALEVGEVVVPDLEEIPPAEPTGAAGALSGLGARHGGGVDVLARDPAEAEVPAFARNALCADADFVDGGGRRERGDEPDAALEADLVGVVSVESDPANLAGGGARRLR